MTNSSYIINKNKLYGCFALILLFAGIILRLAIYLQNRNMIVDEVNIVRNIYERGYMQLLWPLSYDQFAPKFFLWSLKMTSQLFGYGEYSFRLIPLIGSIVSICLMYLILNEFVDKKNVWYSLTFFASGLIFIRYASEIKQYSTDVAVILALLLLCKKKSFIDSNPLIFSLLWAISGGAAIWCAMPSIFILPGIWFYYLLQINKSAELFKHLLAVGIFWSIQFCLYYVLVLKNEINSPYLQEWHSGYFFKFYSRNPGQSIRNLELCRNIFAEISGKTTIAIYFQLLLLALGTIYLAIYNRAQLLLLGMPIFCLLAASQFHQFTMLPRVVLFIMAILLIIICIGFNFLMKIKNTLLRYTIILTSLIVLYNYNHFEYLFKPYYHEEFTQGLELARRENVTNSHFYVNELTIPVYIYYTQIHPGKNKWSDFRNVNLLHWNTNYDTLLSNMSGKNAIIYAWYMEDVLKDQVKLFHKYFKVVDLQTLPGITIYILNDKIK